MTSPESITQHSHIILFDGVCNLCSGWVSFVYKRDVSERFKFVSVQSETGKQLLTWCGLPTDHFDTMVYTLRTQKFNIWSTPYFADSCVGKPSCRMTTAKLSRLALHKISRTPNAKFSCAESIY